MAQLRVAGHTHLRSRRSDAARAGAAQQRQRTSLAACPPDAAEALPDPFSCAHTPLPGASSPRPPRSSCLLLLQYEEGSAPALALQATIAKTERRFDNYSKQGLLCGTDGLPHLIADPGLALRYGHAGDVLVGAAAAHAAAVALGPPSLLPCQHMRPCLLCGAVGRRSAHAPRSSPPLPHSPTPLPAPACPQIPTIGFIYFAGWLGFAGTKYLQAVAATAKPIEKEVRQRGRVRERGWGAQRQKASHARAAAGCLVVLAPSPALA